MAVEDLAWALGDFNAGRHRDAEIARDYYLGRHQLAFAVERFDSIFAQKFLPGITDNLCAAVVDSLADRLELTGFSSSEAERRQESGEARELSVGEDVPAARAWEIWRRNSMDLRSSEVHREALLTGDGYAIVWPDEDGRAAIWVRSSSEMAVRYSETVPGRIDVGARRWRDRQGRWHVDLFYADRVERYEDPREPTAWRRNTIDAALALRDLSALRRGRPIENPFGRVPVFHYPNKRLYDYGLGELGDVLPCRTP